MKKALTIVATLMCLTMSAKAQLPTIDEMRALARGLRTEVLAADSAEQAALALADQKGEDPKIPRAKVYPTGDEKTSVRLDTHTGETHVLDIGEKRKGRYAFTRLLADAVIRDEKMGWDGRFEIFPTTQTYLMIMVDRADRSTYMVLCGPDSSRYLVEKID